MGTFGTPSNMSAAELGLTEIMQVSAWKMASAIYRGPRGQARSHVKVDFLARPAVTERGDTARMDDEALIGALVQGDPDKLAAARLLLGPPEGFPDTDETRH